MEGFPDSSVSKESAYNAGDPGSIPGSGWCTREGIGYPLQYTGASLVAQLVKNLPAIWETCVWSQGWRSSPGLGRSPGEGKSYPLQYSGLENSMDCIIHGVTKSWIWLSDVHTHAHYQHEVVCILSFASLIGEIFSLLLLLKCFFEVWVQAYLKYLY